MADIWNKRKRSEVMSRIKSSDTKPEKRVRILLHGMGYRFRPNLKDLPGKPDIVLPKYSMVIFVHGCFWHLHKGCRDGTLPKSRPNYWNPKLLKNVERDKKNQSKLRRQGWKVLTIWECQIEKKPELIEKKISRHICRKH
jgi:DNA mismatch endonuclease, patch repair protein